MEETSVKGIASTARNKSAIARFKTKTFVLVCRQVKRYKDVKIKEFPNTAARIIKPKMVASKHTVTKERGSPSVVACVDVLTSCKISIFSSFLSRYEHTPKPDVENLQSVRDCARYCFIFCNSLSRSSSREANSSPSRNRWTSLNGYQYFIQSCN